MGLKKGEVARRRNTKARDELTLHILGAQFHKVDMEIVRLLVQRAKLTKKVGEVKKNLGIPLVRREIEEERVEAVLLQARKLFHPNPKDVETIFRLIIATSTVLQV